MSAQLTLSDTCMRFRGQNQQLKIDLTLMNWQSSFRMASLGTDHEDNEGAFTRSGVKDCLLWVARGKASSHD